MQFINKKYKVVFKYNERFCDETELKMLVLFEFLKEIENNSVAVFDEQDNMIIWYYDKEDLDVVLSYFSKIENQEILQKIATEACSKYHCGFTEKDIKKFLHHIGPYNNIVEDYSYYWHFIANGKNEENSFNLNEK